MSAFLATLIVLALFAGAGAVVLLAGRRRNLAAGLALAGFGTFVVLAIAHTGGLRTADPAWFRGSAENGTQDDVVAGRCAELIKLLRDNNVYRDIDGSRIAVQRSRWQQLPTTARTIAVTCIARSKDLDPTQLIIEDQGPSSGSSAG